MGTFATQDMEYSEQITEECVKRSKTCANTLDLAIQTLQPVGLPTQHEVSHLEALYPLLLDGQAVPTVDTIYIKLKNYHTIENYRHQELLILPCVNT